MKQASVYTRDEHNININNIDFHAVKIIKRLRRHGFQAYIVGGAVRDLLLGFKPKDFDLVTDAGPPAARKIFRNSRIIGRRFKLLHVYFPDKKIIEVATFRAIEATSHKNIYGTIEDDVKRRDFTMNALYYCPIEQQVIDYVGGFKDIQKKIVKPVIDRSVIFKEDPVRIIRAIKYSATTGFRIDKKLSKCIRADKDELGNTSSSRLTEELFKILKSGHSADILLSLHSYGILKFLLPLIDKKLNDKQNMAAFSESLRQLDEAARNGRLRPMCIIVKHLVKEVVDPEACRDTINGNHLNTAACELKRIVKPVTFPNVLIDEAAKMILAENDIHFAKKRPPRRDRHRRPHKQHSKQR